MVEGNRGNDSTIEAFVVLTYRVHPGHIYIIVMVMSLEDEFGTKWAAMSTDHRVQ